MSVKQIVFIGLIVSTQLLHAMTFSHHDWEVTCDNTNTCRIAGYSTYYSSLPVSVLLISKANLSEPIEAKVQIGNFSEELEDILKKLPSPFKLELLINNTSHGHVSMDKNTLISSLSQKQTQALIGSLKKSSTIVLKSGKHLWKLSDKGSAAVLLKVDEFQKRLLTPAALLKKGNRSIKNISTSKPIPVIYAKTVESDKELTMDAQGINALAKVLKSDQKWCFEEHLYDQKIRLYPLNSEKHLASKLCWTAAYNMGTAYWIINKQAPYEPKLITTEATDYYVDKNGIATIHAAHKGRGIGDCWSFESHVWNGKTFVLSSDGHTGACRAITAGGAWDFANFISNVKVK
jgi:hypothetical protein